ncbi:hypothetical protein HII36_39415 [Nonomuraea sp. NN258]|uniref:hypothetical protein n=1 Tax=Nonomuraea antri TaxID=2730852 RepID=UPI001569C3A9|nr:hypothetical protein [Nonomuraea antri]NRQ37857.1 hypothetical protein [Nonomuraea antri]
MDEYGFEDEGFAWEEELREIANRLDPVPAELLEDAMRAYALRTLDAELAELTFDSWDVVSATRVRGGGPRLLTFTSRDLVLELEVSGARLVGRTSGGPAEIGVQRRDDETRLRSDALGRFTADALQPGPLRLRVSPAQGDPVVTCWIRI